MIVKKIGEMLYSHKTTQSIKLNLMTVIWNLEGTLDIKKRKRREILSPLSEKTQVSLILANKPSYDV